jgi:hypothetical protein
MYTMSGTGVTNFEFTDGNVLPNTVTNATSGGDNINVFKDGYVPSQIGGKSHRKVSNRKGKTMRKSKKGKKGKKTNKSRKNTTRNRRK